jgi:hypothetical protein
MVDVADSADEEAPWGKIFIIKKDGTDHESVLDLFDEVSEEDPYMFGRCVPSPHLVQAHALGGLSVPPAVGLKPAISVSTCRRRRVSMRACTGTRTIRYDGPVRLGRHKRHAV